MSRKDDDWARYEGKIRVEKPASPSPATRLVKTKPSKKSSKPTPKYTVREDGTFVPYKAAVVNTNKMRLARSLIIYLTSFIL